MKAMKETIFDIILKHREWLTILDVDTDPNEAQRMDEEIKQSAIQYANDLQMLDDRWRNAFEKQIDQAFSAPIHHLHIDKEKYKDILDSFMAKVINVLEYNCGMSKQEIDKLGIATKFRLERIDLRWRIKEHLTRDERDTFIKDLMKQGMKYVSFRELGSILYTVIGTKQPSNESRTKESNMRTDISSGTDSIIPDKIINTHDDDERLSVGQEGENGQYNTPQLTEKEAEQNIFTSNGSPMNDGQGDNSNKNKKFSPKKTIPAITLHSFLIEHNVIPEDLQLNDFTSNILNCEWKDLYSEMKNNKSKSSVKLLNFLDILKDKFFDEEYYIEIIGQLEMGKSDFKKHKSHKFIEELNKII